MPNSFSKRKNKNVTIKSLAAEMGISHTTVSNAWNNPEKLSAELREKILGYARQVGFQGPDKLARALRTGKSGAICWISPSMRVCGGYSTKVSALSRMS